MPNLVNPYIGGGAAALPLDTIRSQFRGMFALRRVFTGHTGNATKIRRISDSVQATIGFTGNAFDLAAANSHVGANGAYLGDTWYDQSGNGNDATAGGSAQVTIIAPSTSVLKSDYLFSNGVTSSAHTFQVPTGMMSGTSSAAVFAIFRQVSPSGGEGSGVCQVQKASVSPFPNTHSPWSDGNVYTAFMSDTRRTISGYTQDFAEVLIAIIHTGSALQFWKNGVQIGSNQTTNFDNTLGAHTFPDTAYGVTGASLIEIAFLGQAPSTGDRQLIEGDMAWSRTGNGNYLPVGHPYKSAAPT